MTRKRVTALFHVPVAIAVIVALAIPLFFLHHVEGAQSTVWESPDISSDTTQARQPSANCWAIIIGVSDYLNYYRDLTYADDDAQALYNVLYPVWGASHIKLLLNAQATKAGIQSAISSWLDPLEDSDDTVLFFFSGHGTQANFDRSPVDEADGMDETICPYDVSRYNWHYDIFDDELTTWLSALESGKQLIILDTCYSGGFITKSGGAKGIFAAPDPEGGYTKDLSKSGRVILTASAENETSRECPYLSHGVFSYYVLDAFDNLEVTDTNKNHEISAEEVFAYARPRTTIYEATQHPQIYDGYAGELPLVTLATLTIDSNPRVTSVTLDGEVYSASKLPVSAYFLAGTNHTFVFSVVTVIESGLQRPKYTFLSWNDNVTSNSRSVTINKSASYVADYKTQYYLTVQSERGNPSGSGWYDQGATAQFSVDSLVDTSGGTRYLFNGWSGNSSGTNNPSSVVMDSPKTITAIWKTQYQLTVLSDRGKTQGSGWYNAGSTANISVTSSSGVIIRRVFSGWSGDSSLDTKEATIHMTGPKTVEAQWRNDYSQLYILIGGLVLIASIVLGAVLLMRSGLQTE